jgi:hypothetical protein
MDQCVYDTNPEAHLPDESQPDNSGLGKPKPKWLQSRLLFQYKLIPTKRYLPRHLLSDAAK